MTELEREELENRIIREYQHQEKLDRDAATIEVYEHSLRAKRKHYVQSTEAISAGGRRNRALAVGECVLKLLDEIGKEHFKHHFLPGTLVFNVFQDRTVDPDGIKGYKYTVAYHADADEPALTDEEIKKEIDETREKLRKETEEMYAEFYEDPDKEAADAENTDEAEPAGGIPEADGQAAQAPGETPGDS